MGVASPIQHPTQRRTCAARPPRLTSTGLQYLVHAYSLNALAGDLETCIDPDSEGNDKALTHGVFVCVPLSNYHEQFCKNSKDKQMVFHLCAYACEHLSHCCVQSCRSNAYKQMVFHRYEYSCGFSDYML